MDLQVFMPFDSFSLLNFITNKKMLKIKLCSLLSCFWLKLA